MKATIVIPTVRAESAQQFLTAWSTQFAGHRVILIEDGPRKSRIGFDGVEHYCWDDIERDLGASSWIIPRRTDCVRSYGIFRASQEPCDLIVSMDDDCLPDCSEFLEQHFRALDEPVEQLAWMSTGDGLCPRGMPYERLARNCRCAINHGLWHGIPDYDAMTQLVNRRIKLAFEEKDQIIPRGMYFPMCGMNVSFRPEFAPVMYFLLMGDGYPYDRFGDIWSGILAKRICDHLGWGVRSGKPSVKHQRASNVWQNLHKEQTEYIVNETFWQAVDSLPLTGSSVIDCYRELATKLPFNGEYWERLRSAMQTWIGLFPVQHETVKHDKPMVVCTMSAVVRQN